MRSAPWSVHVEYRWLVALFAMAAVSTIVALLVGTAVGIPAALVLLNYAGMIWLMSPLTIGFMLVCLLVRAAIKRIPSPIGEIKPFLTLRFGTAAGAAGTIAPILLMPLLMGSFGTLKQVIPLIRPFDWDDALAKADRFLFFGTHPWELTHALIASPILTALVDRLYSLWVLVLFMAVLGFAILAPGHLRARFFLSFGAGWLLIGVIGATVFPSVGPCYAEAVGASVAPDYAMLMQRLHTIHESGLPLNAVDWQEHLWKSHVNRQYGFGLGVSAMPSMHNAVTFLYLLAAGRASLLIRALTGAFTAVIFVGSIHLGWHYAVDGLFAWVAMALIWSAAGAYLRWVGYDEDARVSEKGSLEEVESGKAVATV